MALLRERVVARRPTPVAVLPSVDRIGQHLVDHFIAGSAPDDLRGESATTDLMRQLQVLSVQAQQHATDRPQLREEVHDLLDGVAHGLVGAELESTGERVVRIADRHRHGVLPAPRLVEPSALHAGGDLVALDLREGALQAEEQAIVELGRVVQAVLIADQHRKRRGQLQELIPIQAVASEPRDLQPEHDPHLAQRQQGDQPLVAWPVAALSTREAEIVVDHQAPLRRPAERLRAVGKLVLPQSAFGMLLDLDRRRLPHIDDGQPIQMAWLNRGWVHSSLRSDAAGTPAA